MTQVDLSMAALGSFTCNKILLLGEFGLCQNDIYLVLLRSNARIFVFHKINITIIFFLEKLINKELFRQSFDFISYIKEVRRIRICMFRDKYSTLPLQILLNL